MTRRKTTVWNFFQRLEGDKVVWLIVLMLILISIVCTFSSTSRLLEGNLTRVDMVSKHLCVVAAGLLLIIICYNIKDIEFFRTLSKYGYAVSMVLLILLVFKVNLPFLKSIELNGARRILKVGPLQLHVFEVVKVAMIMYLAWAMDAFKRGLLKGPKEKIWQKVIYIYFPFVSVFVLVIPGSNTAALFIGGLMFLTILLGGCGFKDMMILAAAGLLTAGGAFCLYTLTKDSEHVICKRIGTGVSRVFDNTDYYRKAMEAPDGSKEFHDDLDEIRQSFSAQIAIKEGGLLGKGPGQSTQRYVIPLVSEDYIFSFIVEEYGIWGAMIVLILYVSLMARGSILARNCGRNRFATLAVAGLTLLITGQAFLHMFVNVDIGPMTGQTLPLISHGNSAFLCFSLAFGIILSISRIAEKGLEKEAAQAGTLLDKDSDDKVQ